MNTHKEIEILDSMNSLQLELLDKHVDRAYEAGLTQAPMFNIKGKLPKIQFQSRTKLRWTIIVICSPIILPCVAVVYTFGTIASILQLAIWAVCGDFRDWGEMLPQAKWVLQTFAGYDEFMRPPQE